MKLVGSLLKTPGLTTLQHQLQNLRAEVDALIQDSQNQYYLCSPMLYEYTSGGKQLDGDILARLSQTETYQHI